MSPLTSRAVFQPAYSSWTFDTYEGSFDFQWHHSKTVNVFYNGTEIDVWTYMEVPPLADVLRGINDWLEDHFDGA